MNYSSGHQEGLGAGSHAYYGSGYSHGGYSYDHSIYSGHGYGYHGYWAGYDHFGYWDYPWHGYYGHSYPYYGYISVGGYWPGYYSYDYYPVYSSATYYDTPASDYTTATGTNLDGQVYQFLTRSEAAASRRLETSANGARPLSDARFMPRVELSTREAPWALPEEIKETQEP